MAGAAERPETATHGYLYLLLRADLVKIGITMDPARRARQLTTGAGIAPDLFAAWWTYAPGAAERYFHEKLSNFRAEGEFFRNGKKITERLLPYLDARAQRCREFDLQQTAD